MVNVETRQRIKHFQAITWRDCSGKINGSLNPLLSLPFVWTSQPELPDGRDNPAAELPISDFKSVPKRGPDIRVISLVLVEHGRAGRTSDCEADWLREVHDPFGVFLARLVQ